ncbi:MAG: hypothetical protein J1E01_03080 [Acetatifactor sp.]|nr:hypothetical protein [Acetatifactor sp.]
MDNNMNAGVPFNGAAAPQPQGDDQKKGPAGLKLDAKVIALAAVVVLLLLIILVPNLAKAVPEGKAKKAVKTYVQVFLSGDKRDNDVKWTKFYPKDFDRQLEDWAEEYADRMSFEDVENYKVLSVTQISGKDVKGILEDEVESFFKGQVSYYSGKEIKDRDIDALKISKAYIVTTKFEYDRDVQVVSWLVIKVNGRYGVYGYNVILSE